MFWPFPNVLKSAPVLLAALLAAGCGQNDIKVYSVPKETPPAMAEAPETAPQLKWETPNGWQELPASSMRVASFKITGQDGKQADVSVIPLGGVAGGEASNVNRWRGQIGLPPATEEEIAKLAEPVAISGQTAKLFTLTGSPNSILAAVQLRAGTAWFFKMTGDTAVVAQQKPAFVAFLKSCQFNAAEPSEPGTPRWTAPADWKEVPGGQFLVAKFELTGAAVNISSSTGDGGGLSANVNRWRKQLGLPEASPEELAKSAQRLTIPTGNAMLVQLSGEDPKTGQKTDLVGAIVLRPGQAWFYKLMGNPAAVAAQKDAFIKFVREVKY